ncbi:MAG TPA: hypothetical protein VGI81_01460 [Tepidisphaeraceae bacterium]|jgi:hypothetical protein
MLLQTNSYIVPRETRAAHAKLLTQFRQTLARLGCDLFEVYEQVDANWESSAEGDVRIVQIMRFRDREHQLAVQAAERNDPSAQRMITAFCELINFPYQQEHGLFAVGFYTEMAAVTEPQSAPQPAPAAPAPAHPVDVQAYIERELDDIMATFGDPRQMLQDLAQPPPAPSSSQQPAQFPRLAEQSPSTPLQDEDLDSLLHEQFAPAPAGRDAHAIDSDLNQVLDQGLAEDELDIPMPAELLDEGETDGLHHVPEPVRPDARVKKRR